MDIHLVRSDELAALGELIAASYAAIDPIGLGDYEDELRDVAGRAEGADVLVAGDGNGAVLGGVTYVPGPGSPSAEFVEPDAAGIRMLAVSVDAQGQGVGAALVEACIDRARAAGKAQVILHTTDWMTSAHRLYQRLGFERDPSIDWHVVSDAEDFWLRGFRLKL
ncbi:MAG: GNAT family N-acetyltransferase [Acidimicrobiales bacterium]